MPRKRTVLFLLFLLLPAHLASSSYAFFCPTNFSQIYPGDTIERVKQTCGNPTLETSYEKEPEAAQQWSYYIPQTVAFNDMAPAQGTLKTEITFDPSGKAINISVNGIGVGSSTICGGMIQLGDSRDTIKNACGNPSFIAKQDPGNSTATQTPTKITELIYGTGSPVKLKFVNGKLEGS
jgi:hypothetical protein